MCALRRIADIAQVAAKRLRTSSQSAPLWRRSSQISLSDSELSDLTSAVAAVTPAQLGVHKQHFTHDALERGYNAISYISVMKNDNVMMAIFVMPPGSEIPLHDHAHMFVASNVLWGQLEVQTYDLVASALPSFRRERVALRRKPELVGAGDVRTLSPTLGNVHSFKAMEWTAVFDVLVPPYDAERGRECHYFTPLEFDEPPSSLDSKESDRVFLKVSNSATSRCTSLLP